MSDILLELSGSSKSNPVQLASIAWRTGLSKRSVRAKISDLQSKGYWIVNLKKGYYLTLDKNDLESYKKRETKRAITILNKLKHLVPEVEQALKQLRLGI